MADIVEIVNGELNADIRAKLNTLIGQANGGIFAEAALGGATDYLEVGPDGTLSLKGAATAWDDLDFAMTIRTGGENPPVWTQLATTGCYGWAFQNGDEAHFQRQIRHAFKVGQTGWSPHVHWMPTTTATYTGTWTMTLTGHITSTDPAAAPLLTTITRTGAFSVSATAWNGHLTELNNGTPGLEVDGSAWGISTILYAKLSLALSAGAACLLSGFDLHGEIDSFGSAQEYIK